MSRNTGRPLTSRAGKSRKTPKSEKAQRVGVESAGGHGDAAVRRCPVARECGGCQRVSQLYADQLAEKQAFVVSLFAEAGLISGSDAPCLRPIKGMVEPYFYRNKVMSPFVRGKRLPAQRDGRRPQSDGRGARDRSRASRPRYEILTGMYAAGTHRVVSTDGCLVENENAQAIVRSIRALMPRFGLEPYREDEGAGFLRHAVVRTGHQSGEVLVTLVTNGEDFPASRAFCRELVKRCHCITTVVQNVNERRTNVALGEREKRLYGPGFILDRLCGLSFRISSQAFYQVNAVQTEVLYECAMELAGLDGAQSVMDAYCGTGTIGLVAAARGAREVVGVDTVESAVRDARENARHNGVENARFVAADAGAFMREQAAAGPGSTSCSWTLRAPERPRNSSRRSARLRPSAWYTFRAIRARRCVMLPIWSNADIPCRRCSPSTCSPIPIMWRR